jgi:hypothetical protein
MQEFKIAKNKLWQRVVLGSGNTFIDPDVRKYAMKEYSPMVKKILENPDPEQVRSNLAIAAMCAKRTGSYASAKAYIEDCPINISIFKWACGEVRDKYGNLLGGPLC